MSVSNNNNSLSQDLWEVEKKQHEELIGKGYKIAHVEEGVIRYGQGAVRVVYQKPGNSTAPDGKLTRGEKAIVLGKNIAATILTGGLANISPAIREDWEKGYSGHNVEEKTFAHFQAPQLHPDFKITKEEDKKDKQGNSALQAKLNYIPSDRKSVAAYAVKNKDKMMDYHGHGVIPEHRRGRVSSFIFCPNGDPSKARSIKVWDAESGNSIKDSEKYMLAMRDYCASYDDKQKEFRRIATEMTDNNYPNLTGDNRKRQIKKYFTELKAFAIEINATNEGIFIHSHATSGSRTGLELKNISKSTWENIKRAHNKKETKLEQKMEGERPYASANDKKASEQPPTKPGKLEAEDDDGPGLDSLQ